MSISKYDCARCASSAKPRAPLVSRNSSAIMLARSTQRANTALRALLLEPLGVVARGDDLLSTFGELPLLEQPAADGRMVDAETLLLALDQRRLAPLLRTEPRVQLGHGVIERHDADVLDQAREKQLFAVLDADDAREHVARRRSRTAPGANRAGSRARRLGPRLARTSATRTTGPARSWRSGR